MVAVPKPKMAKKKKRKRLKDVPLEKWPFQKLQKEADKWYSLYIRHRDGYKCVICGSKVNPQCGHLIKRGKQALRYNGFNCNVQCSKHNLMHNFYPEYYTQWFINRHGAEKYNWLLAKAGQLKKWRKEELISIINLSKQAIGGNDETVSSESSLQAERGTLGDKQTGSDSEVPVASCGDL